MKSSFSLSLSSFLAFDYLSFLSSVPAPGRFNETKSDFSQKEKGTFVSFPPCLSLSPSLNGTKEEEEAMNRIEKDLVKFLLPP